MCSYCASNLADHCVHLQIIFTYLLTYVFIYSVTMVFHLPDSVWVQDVCLEVKGKDYKAPLTLEIYFEILFQNKTVEIFLLKVSTFTLKKHIRKLYVNNISSTLHSIFVMPIHQLQLSVSDISSTNFHKIERVLNCEIEFRNLVLSKVDCSTSH